MPTSEPSTFTQKSAEELERENVLRRQENLRKLQQQDIERQARHHQKHLRLKQLYQHETLEQKVRRLAGNSRLDYDNIRWVVETDLVLKNPTPARIRERRELVARLISKYRYRIQWQNKPLPMTQEERKALYRKGVRLMHPDRAKNAVDCQYRNRVMAALNNARDAGDDDGMQNLLRECEVRSKATADQERNAQREFA